MHRKRNRLHGYDSSGGKSFTFTSKVGLIDQYGNGALATAAVTVSVAQSGTGGGVTTSGSMTIPIGASLTPGTFTGTAANKNNNTAHRYGDLYCHGYTGDG